MQIRKFVRTHNRNSELRQAPTAQRISRECLLIRSSLLLLAGTLAGKAYLFQQYRAAELRFRRQFSSHIQACPFRGLASGVRINNTLSTSGKHDMGAIWSEYVPVFLVGIGSLLPLINPIGTAMIVERYFEGLSQAERKRCAFLVTLNCFVLGVATLHLGSRILEFMGVSISATQAAGGIVIALLGYGLLNNQQKPSADEKSRFNISENLFYPIAFPLTLGPGSVSTLIALSASVHDGQYRFFSIKLTVLSVALFAILVVTYFCFAYNNKISARIGATGNQVLNRLLAFLVFCIGIQMAFNGVMGLIRNAG